jgi:hypothetical protein
MAFNFEFRIEGLTRAQAEKLLEFIRRLVDFFDATMAGGFAEVGDEDVEPAS